MRRLYIYTSYIIVLNIVFLFSFNCGFTFALINPSPKGNTVLSKVDLKRYFEKAMALFENGKYKEAIIVFENLIELEKSQNESYFTPFSEIYIEKSRERMKEMLVLDDKRWKKMKEDVIGEAERIAKKKADELAEEEEKFILREERMRRKELKEIKEEKVEVRREKLEEIYKRGMEYYTDRNYPMAIIEFKKIRELEPDSELASRARVFIEAAQKNIKEEEEREVLAKMEAARSAKISMEQEEREKRILREREEERRRRLEKAMEHRKRAKELREKIARIEELLDTIRMRIREERLQEARELADKAIMEFPENERFKDILHYVEMQQVKLEEKALKRAREITEEKMLLEVARKHMIPEEKAGVLEDKKEITPLVKVPEIRKKLKIPISVDFQDVELDYVLSFLSDATGVNIIPSSQIDMEEKLVTIKVKDMPLEEALKYILKTQDLVYRIEEDAVWVAAEEELENENVETRVYFLNQGMGRFAEVAAAYEEEGMSGTEVRTVKDILENAVDWPKDSKLTVDERTGALIISNIPSNLEVVENLLYSLDVTPVQVLIEARFLELTVTDTDELGIDWQLNSAWGLKQNNEKQDLHGFASNSGVDFSNFTNQDYGFNLTYQGILSHPQFQAVLHAFQEKQNVKTLSAPRITTLNNQTATIEVIDEYIYPTRYEVSLVQYDINGDGDFDDAGETEWANIPQDFVTRDVGILLHVKPSVGVDNETVTLALTPEVSEQDTTTPSISYSGSVTIPNFKTRNLSTSVIVESGETVVMGGLIKESNTKTETKVPLLGDLPLVGGLFRKNYEGVERRNLLIFVTATVLNEEENIMASVPGDEEVRREQ